MLKLDMNEIKKRLSATGLNEFILDSVIEVLMSIPIIVELEKGIITNEKDFEIKLDSSQNVLTTSNFTAKIPGINENQILSITIPKLSYNSSNVLILKIECYPFKIDNEFFPDPYS